jgi:xylose isomerase
MDTYARGLKIAHELLQSGKIESFIEERYASYQSGIGKKIVDGRTNFTELEAYALENDQVKVPSGRQELLEGIVNQYL